MSNIINTIPRDPKKGIKIFTPADIFPQYEWGKQEEPTQGELQRKLDGIFYFIGGKK